MVYLWIGLFFLITGFRLLLGAGRAFFGAGVYFDFGEGGMVAGVFFLAAGIWLIVAAKKSFNK